MAALHGGAGRVLFAFTALKCERRAAAHVARLLQHRSLRPIVEELGGGRARRKRSWRPADACRRR
tara:strand:+ start:325 stop:519 length:195 start_codon:yes stop_codon:yes gene_type:complete